MVYEAWLEDDEIPFKEEWILELQEQNKILMEIIGDLTKDDKHWNEVLEAKGLKLNKLSSKSKKVKE